MKPPFKFSSATLVIFGLMLGLVFFGLFGRASFKLELMDQQELNETVNGGDFRIFWAQGWLVARGDAVKVYDAPSMLEVSREHAHLPEGTRSYGSFYPPHFMLLMEPFGHLGLPEAWRLYAWGSLLILIGAAAFAFRQQPYAVPLLLAFPGLWSGISFGQVSIALTALYLLIMALMTRYPRTSGLLLGLASVKPHLGVLAPLMLIWRRQWTVFLWAVLGTVLLLVLACVLYGPDLFGAYVTSIMAPVQRLVDFHGVAPANMISLYGGLRRLDVAPVSALLAHTALVLPTLYLLHRICRSAQDPQLPMAGMITAILIVMPHAYAYDMLLLYIPIMVIIRRAQERGWSLADLEAIALPFLLPLFVREVTLYLKLPLVPFVLLLLLYRLHHHSRMDAPERNC